MPAGVPLGLVVLVGLLPPQEHTHKSKANGRQRRKRALICRPFGLICIIAKHNTEVTQDHLKGQDEGVRAARVRDVVLTLIVKVNAVVALTVSLDGTEQVAPVGAPEQVNVAVPLTPSPPIASL